jgi:hypothetical protein
MIQVDKTCFDVLQVVLLPWVVHFKLVLTFSLTSVKFIDFILSHSLLSNFVALYIPKKWREFFLHGFTIFTSKYAVLISIGRTYGDSVLYFFITGPKTLNICVLKVHKKLV